MSPPTKNRVPPDSENTWRVNLYEFYYVVLRSKNIVERFDKSVQTFEIIFKGIRKRFPFQSLSKINLRTKLQLPTTSVLNTDSVIILVSFSIKVSGTMGFVVYK